MITTASTEISAKKLSEAFGDIMNASDSTCAMTASRKHRIAKMYVDEVFGGLDYSQFPKITVIENKMNVEEMVCVEDIDLTSTCEHHFTIDGSGVAYIPNENIGRARSIAWWIFCP